MTTPFEAIAFVEYRCNADSVAPAWWRADIRCRSGSRLPYGPRRISIESSWPSVQIRPVLAPLMLDQRVEADRGAVDAQVALRHDILFRAFHPPASAK